MIGLAGVLWRRVGLLVKMVIEYDHERFIKCYSTFRFQVINYTLQVSSPHIPEEDACCSICVTVNKALVCFLTIFKSK